VTTEIYPQSTFNNSIFINHNNYHLLQELSSAIAERPRDASHMSVVSFMSTIPQLESSIISYFSFRFTNGHS